MKTVRVRLAWAKRLDYTPTAQQVERGLSDPIPEIRRVWSVRTDFVPSPEQIERGLVDCSEKVRAAWQDRLKRMALDAQDELLVLDQLEMRG